MPRLNDGASVEFKDLKVELCEIEEEQIHGGEYTEEIHAERLNAILHLIAHESELCPATFGFTPSESPEDNWDNDPCFVCAEAVGVSLLVHGSKCPCNALGCEEALRKSLVFLERMGYKQEV